MFKLLSPINCEKVWGIPDYWFAQVFMTQRLRSWLATADPNLAAQGGMLPGIFTGTSTEMGKHLGWMSPHTRYQSDWRYEQNTENVAVGRLKLSIRSFYYLIGWLRFWWPFPNSFWQGSAQNVMDQMHIWTFSPVFGNNLNGASQTIQFTKKLRRSVAALSRLQFMGMKDEDWLKFHYW